MAHVRAADGTLSVMHDTVRGTEVAGRSTYRVPIFNPSTDATQASRLRLINPGDAAATVTISGRDDTGAVASGGEVQLTISANGARTLTAQQLEAGDASLTGRLGAGVGRWRLYVSADRPIRVVNVAVTSAGVWNNPSTTAVRGPAPSDRGAFNERFDGLGVVYETDGGRFTLSPQAGDRFIETGESDGMAVSRSGTYRYRGIGPDAGRLMLTYDNGNACAGNFYFSSRTGGWFASHCTGSDHPDGSWLGGTWYADDGVDTSPAFGEGDCYVGLIVGIGESCTYPGTEDAFSVNVRGRGRFLDRLAGIRIRINNETINTSIRGAVSDPDGSVVEGIRLSAVADAFWAWGETGSDGSFEIRLPDGASGSTILSAHAGDIADCGWLGYFGTDGLTILRERATPIEVGEVDPANIEITLPAIPAELCHGQRTISGTVLGPDGDPVAVWMRAFGRWSWTGDDGQFELTMPEISEASHSASLLFIDAAQCGHVGYYRQGGFTAVPADASQVERGRADATGIEITLTREADELCGQ